MSPAHSAVAFATTSSLNVKDRRLLRRDVPAQLAEGCLLDGIRWCDAPPFVGGRSSGKRPSEKRLPSLSRPTVLLYMDSAPPQSRRRGGRWNWQIGWGPSSIPLHRSAMIHISYTHLRAHETKA